MRLVQPGPGHEKSPDGPRHNPHWLPRYSRPPAPPPPAHHQGVGSLDWCREPARPPPYPVEGLTPAMAGLTLTQRREEAKDAKKRESPFLPSRTMSLFAFVLLCAFLGLPPGDSP